MKDKVAISLSIIIPTYNSSKTIDNCLRSVITQNVEDMEVWVIDGNSIDETIKIVKSYQLNHKCIKWISEPDRGIYDAMNKGVKACSGEWIYFLGSDDSLHTNTVLNELLLATNSNANTKFVYGDVLTSARQVQSYKDHSYEKLIKLNICHQAIFYHHTLFDHISYDLKYTICADWDLNLKVFRKKNNPIYLNKIIANYSLDGASNEWDNHLDYINNFKPLNMVLRYRNIFYFAYLYILKQLKNIKSLISNLIRWISR